MAEGKISYSLDKPEYEFSTDTTQFDDELMKRGIVTFEQAMIAKGASPVEARRLACTKYGRREGDLEIDDTRYGDTDKGRGKGKGDNDDDSDDDNDDNYSSSESQDENDTDDEFLEKYRQMRLKELRGASHPSHGRVAYISRSDWTREVNEASGDGQWVVVNLTRGSDSAVISTAHIDACQAVEDATAELAAKFPDVKFVSITSSSANENWPPQSLPTLFCYKDGKLQRQLIGLDEFGGHGITTGRVEWRLAQLGVVETELEYDPEKSSVEQTCTTAVPSREQHRGHSHFGGMMSTWATRRDSEEDLSDID